MKCFHLIENDINILLASNFWLALTEVFTSEYMCLKLQTIYVQTLYFLHKIEKIIQIWLKLKICHCLIQTNRVIHEIVTIFTWLYVYVQYICISLYACISYYTLRMCVCLWVWMRAREFAICLYVCIHVCICLLRIYIPIWTNK